MLSISPSLIPIPPHLLAPFQCQSLPCGHSQSVKKTWAALYLEVGGSLKSLIREWMDWKREGAAGLGRKALWASLLAQGELCTSIPSPHWSQDTPHGHSCPSQHLTQATVSRTALTFSEGVMRYTASRLGRGSRRLLMSSTTWGEKQGSWQAGLWAGH